MHETEPAQPAAPFQPSDPVAAMPLGVVLQRKPGVTRWQRWTWTASAVLPGAGPADWQVLRGEDSVTEFHAATLTLELHRAEVEAYRVSLMMEPPAVFVVLRPNDDPDFEHDYIIHAVTASAYEAQDYMDSGEEIVEAVPMPPGLIAWVTAFSDTHFVDEPFVKRKRDKKRVDLVEDGIGDARIRQAADVYRAPASLKSRRPS